MGGGDQVKIDLFKQHKEEYAAPKKPVILTVPKAQYLSVSGRGAPGSDEFEAKVGALYSAAYTIKMTRKASGLEDYVICKLECRWSLEGGRNDFGNVPIDKWLWRFLIRTPDFIGKADLEEAAGKLIEKGKGAGVTDVELIPLPGERAVQMLHVGPYEKEGETVAIMLKQAEDGGLERGAIHHEIYLSDPRRVEPENLRTILRIPLR